MTHRLALLLAALLLVAGTACKEQRQASEGAPPPVAPALVHEDDGSAPPARLPASTEPSGDEEKRLWQEILDRGKCGLLPGCDAAKKLVALGPDAAARAAARIKADKSDRQWRLELARELSRVRDDRVRNWQREALADPLWPVRAYAAVGLGRAHDAEFISAARDHLKKEGLPGMRVAIWWALALAREPDARLSLVRLIAGLPRLPDIRIDLIALEAVADLRLTEALPDVRARLGHSNLFVLRAAARTVEVLLDKSSIPLLIPLLDHETELVRNAALDTLRRFTGQKHRKTAEQFDKWCAQYCRPDWPRPKGAEAPKE